MECIPVIKTALQKPLNYPRLRIFFLLVVVAGNIWLYISHSPAFSRTGHREYHGRPLKADQSSSYQAIAGKLENLINMIRSDPAVARSFGAYFGSQSGRAAYSLP